ncbi:toxin co-regulated pilus biosynthesis Q family protein [Roseibium sp. RKSG952]|uniref:toxin co-regulated pilus biosynthesis Q family protein n=1 Tax=Roseibium sp. RKSG952 TaxID=2529384 RepID=UPI0012BCD8B4|nr:toxin co-regulated pilus biosynthesis Q family protein [Roseibium sp. RKSG952]MTH97580.1 hypothetical protein [Roseibium sp. RKSG952]
MSILKSRRGGVLGLAALALALTTAASHASYEGFGKDIPLSSAVGEIVPDGWKIEYADGVDESTAISWGADSDWKASLSSALSKKDLKAAYGSSTVLIESAPKVASRPYAASASVPSKRSSSTASVTKPRMPSKPNKPAMKTAAVGGSGGFTMVPYEEPAVHKPSGDGIGGKGSVDKDGWSAYAGDAVLEPGLQDGHYHAVVDYTLRTTLQEWADDAEWKLVWDSGYDYMIDASASFSGDFVEATTALADAMSAARPRITINFYKGNRVLVVSNDAADLVN